MHPTQMRETRNPLFPKLVYFMVGIVAFFDEKM